MRVIFYDLSQTWLVSFSVWWQKNNLTLAHLSVRRRKRIWGEHKGEIWSEGGESCWWFYHEKYRDFYRIQWSINTFHSYPFSLSRNPCVTGVKPMINEIKYLSEHPILVPRRNGYRITSFSKNLPAAAKTVDRHRFRRIVFRKRSIENKPTYDGNEN